MGQAAVLASTTAVPSRSGGVVASVARNVSVMLAAQVVTFALSFVLRAALGRYLGDASFGKLTFALSVGAIFVTIGGLGLGPFVAKEVARSRDLTGHYLANGIVLRLLIGLPLYAGFCLVVTWLKSDFETRALTELVGLSFLVNLLVTMTGAVFQAHEKMIYVSIGLVVEKLLTTVLAIAALLLGYGLLAVGLVMVLGALANLLVSTAFLARLGTIRITVDLRSVQSLFISSLPFFIWAAFTTIYARIDATMLSLMTTDTVTGWYGVSYALYETLSFLPGLIKTVVLPVLSRLSVDDEGHFRTTFRQMLYCYSLITPAIAFGTYALARPIVGLIYPLDQFGNSVGVLQVLALGFIPLFYNILLATAVVAVDRQRIWSFAAIACAVINPAMNLVLIPYFQMTTGNGGIGAAWATNAIEVLLLFVGFSLLPAGLIGAREIELALRAALAGLAMAGLLVWQHELSLPLSLVIGATAYVTCCWALGIVKVDELRSVLALLRDGRSSDEQRASAQQRTTTDASRQTTATSVVIPTHDRRDLLRRVLVALSQQTYPVDQLEVVVVVDGSGDGTDEMLESLRVPYRLFVLRQDQRGAAAARNAGLDAAHGRTIIFIDDDVIPTPELVRAHASIHDRDDNAVVIGRFLPCPEAKRTGWVRWEDAIAARGYRRIQRGEATVDGSLFYSGNVSAPRQSLLDVGGFDTSLASQEDVELGHRLQAAGLTFYFEPRAAGFHCGQCPDFASWCRRHYRFGAYRFVIQRRAGPANVSSIDESFARRNVLTLLLLRLTSGRPVAMDVSAAALRAAAMAVDFAHLWPVSRFVYSALANLHYWRGIQDRMVEDGYGDGYAVE